LRGGGCGATKQKTKPETIRRPLPKNFCGDLEQYLNTVTEKCHLANDEQ
jgi:hypothetical protein